MAKRGRLHQRSNDVLRGLFDRYTASDESENRDDEYGLHGIEGSTLRDRSQCMSPTGDGEFLTGCIWALIVSAFFWTAVVLLWWVLQEAGAIAA